MNDKSVNTGDIERGYSGLSLLGLLVILAKRKKVIIGVPLLATLAALAITFLVPNVYTASTIVLPPQQNQSSAVAMVGQLGNLAGLAGSQLAIKNPSELYVTMLRSRTVADTLIERFDLKNRYRQDTAPATRRALASATDVNVGKDGAISIHVDDRDPKHAAALANGYVDELFKLTQTLAITEASQRRLFFEKQLQVAKKELAEAEVGLRQTQETTGLIKLDDQGRAIIEGIARLQAQVAAKEVQLGAMRAFITETNPDFILAQKELAGLRTQLTRAEQDQKKKGGRVLMATDRIPEAGLEYARKIRDVKYYETVFELLAKHYELAKIDEARDTSIIQVLDRAVEPEEKSKPKRVLIVTVSAFLALAWAILWVLLKESAERAGRDPERAELLRQLRQYAWRRERS